MPFFPGFTDHSPRHINDVLKTASALISDESHSLLSPEDVAVLIIAILLHDCGMHLTQDGFRALISSDTSSTIINELKDVPWKKLWIEFIAESRRFGEDRLIAIFGEATPLVGDLDIDNFTERDCLLIGEFVRRNHARLAHEIAIKGVPTIGASSLQIQGIDPELRDLAGLVARSHGMNIRSTFPYIKSKYHRIPEYRSVKTPYLMAVIRIADYVQVQGERAIKTLLSVKELRSPVSRQEWRNHFAVSDVTMRHEDPEAMYVHAKPIDVKTFIKLEKLFKDIQRELDASWATVGEVYGRLGDLSKLGLTIRRIRSNIESRENFAPTVSYIPIETGFQTSGPDLLKLLVGPLYDYKYNIGIRELLQNAVDACRELTDIQSHQNKLNCVPSISLDIQESDDGTGWVTVTDTGVGMTLETITKYFLTAGASFRNSDIWKKKHTNNDGQSRVLRGGRFGVGALAAFLIGDEISVRTRYFDSNEEDGIEFSARMDDPIVELRRHPAPSGTSITVRVANPEAMKSIRPYIYLHEAKETVELKDWDAIDWFTQTEPSVKYSWSGIIETVGKKKIKIKAHFSPQKNLTPTKFQKNEKWLAVTNPGPYEEILWCYPEPNKEARENDIYRTTSREVVVNGLRVTKLGDYSPQDFLSIPDEQNFWTSPSFYVKRPTLAIFDPAGDCPINLQRSSVSFERMNKDVVIARSILENYIGKIQSYAPKNNAIQSFASFIKNISNLPGVHYSGNQLPPHIHNHAGTSFRHGKIHCRRWYKKCIFHQIIKPRKIKNKIRRHNWTKRLSLYGSARSNC